MTRLFVLICAFVAPAFAALAQPETHFVGIYEGVEETDGRVHGPEARLRIDRPGAEIVLILADYGPVRWFVDVAPGTTLSEVIVAGYQPERSEVVVTGGPEPKVRLDTEMPDPHETVGLPFRELIDTLATRDDLPPLLSFNGSYRAPEAGFVIDATSAPVPEMSPNYLEAFVRPDRLTASLQDAMTSWTLSALEFNESGFIFRNPEKPDVEQIIPVTLDVPDISWPQGAAIDTRRGVYYGISSGGEGFLYAYDLATETWRVMRSMDRLDAGGLLYDESADRLIIVGDMFHSSMEVWVLDPADEGATLEQLSIDPLAFHGLTDLYDVGNYRPPPLIPVAIDGDLVLVRTGADWPFIDDAGLRSYVIDLSSGTVDLVDFVN